MRRWSMGIELLSVQTKTRHRMKKRLMLTSLLSTALILYVFACSSARSGPIQGTNDPDQFRALAEQGDASAQAALGYCYYHGSGVDSNVVEATKWYQKAADKDNARAENALGLCYLHGIGVEKNIEEAIRLIIKSAEQGYATAQCNLGLCYKNGTGVAKDVELDKQWFRKAADQGYARAKGQLDSLSGDLAEKSTGFNNSSDRTQAQDGNNTSNPPPSTNAKSPTYEQTLEWLKKTLANNDCYYAYTDNSVEPPIVKNCVEHHEIEKCEDAEMVLNRGGDSKYKFYLSAITNADVKLYFTHANFPEFKYDRTIYSVFVNCKAGKPLINWIYPTEKRGIVSKSLTSLSIFDTTDGELAQRVARAFDHLLELAPKDDLFK